MTLAGAGHCLACGGTLDESPALVGRDRLHAIPGEFAVRVCRVCGSGTTMPLATDQEVALFYPADYSAYREADRPPGRLRAWLRRMRDGRVLRGMPFRDLGASAPGSLLDVGCGKGQIGGPFAETGWRVVGVDPSPQACAAAAARGIDARQGTLADARLGSDERFDVVVFHHSLEHSTDPAADLKRTARALAPEGRILVSVPNFGGWQQRRFGSASYNLDLPRHRAHFTPAGLSLALERAGFAVAAMSTTTSTAGFLGSCEIAIRGKTVLHGGLAARAVLPVALLTALPVRAIDRVRGGGDVLHAVAETTKMAPADRGPGGS
jgi:SAM-dependent methyltransferase